eukprot:5093059-Prymnesium_polylepis.1
MAYTLSPLSPFTVAPHATPLPTSPPPGEKEFLFPPLTYLLPMSQPRELRVDDVTYTVIDVKAQANHALSMGMVPSVPVTYSLPHTHTHFLSPRVCG